MSLITNFSQPKVCRSIFPVIVIHFVPANIKSKPQFSRDRKPHTESTGSKIWNTWQCERRFHCLCWKVGSPVDSWSPREWQIGSSRCHNLFTPSVTIRIEYWLRYRLFQLYRWDLFYCAIFVGTLDTWRRQRHRRTWETPFAESLPDSSRWEQLYPCTGSQVTGISDWNMT